MLILCLSYLINNVIAEKPRQSGCPAGMRCRYMHEYTDMRCVDENYDSSEDSDEYDTWDSTAEVSWESHSQEGEITKYLRVQAGKSLEITVKKVASNYYFCEAWISVEG